MSASEVILEVGAEGGAITLYGVLRARDVQKLAQAKREVGEMLERVRRAQSNSA